jgi:hypothetical protein
MTTTAVQKLALAGAAVAVVALAATAASAQVAGFKDVPTNHWASQSVGALAQAGIVKGYSTAPLAAGAQTKKPAAGAAATGAYSGDKPVTRYELAVTLYRFVTYIERADRQKKSSTGAWLQGEPKSGADAVKKLVAMGYLPKNTPLATDGAKLVTANQLADAMAAVITKSRERTTPLSKGSLKDIEKPESREVPGT